VDRPRRVQTTDDAFELFRWLSEQERVAFDTETTSFSLYDPDFKVRLIQFGTASDAWCVDFQRWRGFVADVFGRFEGEWIAHNSRFDVTALKQSGIEVPLDRVHDTMIMLRLAEPTVSAGLKEAATRHVSTAAAASQRDLHAAMRKAGWSWATVPIDYPPYLFYAAMDTILTARLFDTSAAVAGRRSPVYSLELEVRAACNIMEENGTYVDTVLALRQSVAMRAEASELKTKAKDVYGVSVSSTEELGRWLIASDARSSIVKSTPKGRPSVDKETLEKVIAECPGSDAADVATMALRSRKLDKLCATYFENFTESSHDGVLHPQIETIAARTGRMSVRDPALQTLPAGEDPEAKMVRRCVVPRDPDHVVVSADAAQIELRLIAALSKDPGLIDAFRVADDGGVDFFTTSARAVYEDESIIKGDPRRDTTKTYWYASAYGAGTEKMAWSAGVPVSVMAAVRAGMLTRYPGFFKFMADNERETRENGGFIETAYGRRLPVDEGKEYVATNTRIQGTAADVMKTMIVTLAQAGFDDMMIVPVHDEIVASVPRADLPDLIHELEANMACYDFEVPLIVEANYGDSWGDAK
jgi:DNA polymerase-1